jgi:hypothetical protein
MSTRDPSLSALGRQAHRVAGEIRLLAEQGESVGMNPDPHSWEEIRFFADTLDGLAYGCAFEAQDMDLLFEMTGRRWRMLDDPGQHGTSPDAGGREAGPRG